MSGSLRHRLGRVEALASPLIPADELRGLFGDWMQLVLPFIPAEGRDDAIAAMRRWIELPESERDKTIEIQLSFDPSGQHLQREHVVAAIKKHVEDEGLRAALLSELAGKAQTPWRVPRYGPVGREPKAVRGDMHIPAPTDPEPGPPELEVSPPETLAAKPKTPKPPAPVKEPPPQPKPRELTGVNERSLRRLGNDLLNYIP